MKLAIIGSRSFTNEKLLDETLNRYWYWCHQHEDGHDEGYLIDEIVSGGARGADTLGAQWATAHQIKLTIFKPDWERHGKRAGFLRNADIIAAADVVLAFWGLDPEGKELSRGTANSLSIAKRLKKTTIIVYV